MITDYSEEIIDDLFFNVIKKDNSIIINLKNKNNVLISSWLNGGLCHNMGNVVNMSTDEKDYDDLTDGDFEIFQKNKFLKLGLNPEKTTGLLTSACMDNCVISVKKYEKLKVTSIVTAGADKNAVKAGDPASFYEYNNNYFNHFGTINIIILIDANLHDGALVTASITATEAKTSVLQDLKIESQYSSHIATGTGTDGICIISNKDSQNHIENAGKHSKLGELIATSIQENNNTQNVAFVSSIINLIDEVNIGLLKLEDILTPVNILLTSYLHLEIENKKIENVEDIIFLLIDSINKYLFD